MTRAGVVDDNLDAAFKPVGKPDPENGKPSALRGPAIAAVLPPGVHLFVDRLPGEYLSGATHLDGLHFSDDHTLTSELNPNLPGPSLVEIAPAENITGISFVGGALVVKSR